MQISDINLSAVCVSDNLKRPSEESDTDFVPFRGGQNGSGRFVEGIMNVGIEVEYQGRRYTTFLRHTIPEKISTICRKETISVICYCGQDEVDSAKIIVPALVAFPRIREGMSPPYSVYRSRWFSAKYGGFWSVREPIGWRTGHPAVDRQIEERDQSEEVREHFVRLCNKPDTAVPEALIDAVVKGLFVKIHPSCLSARFESPFNEDFKVSNLFVGPYDETIDFDIGHGVLQ